MEDFQDAAVLLQQAFMRQLAAAQNFNPTLQTHQQELQTFSPTQLASLGLPQSTPLPSLAQQLHLHMQQQRQPPPTRQSNETTPDGLREKLEAVKKALKSRAGYESAAKELAVLIPTLLSNETKRAFYDALNIISFRAGTPGYPPAAARDAFRLAIQYGQHFTAGFRKNISDWYERLEKIIADPRADVPNPDGRFPSNNSMLPQRKLQAQTMRQARKAGIPSAPIPITPKAVWNQGITNTGPQVTLSDQMISALLNGSLSNGRPSQTRPAPLPVLQGRLRVEDGRDSDSEDEESAAARVWKRLREYPFLKSIEILVNPYVRLQHEDVRKDFEFFFSEQHMASLQDKDSIGTVQVRLSSLLSDGTPITRSTSVNFSVNGVPVVIEDKFKHEGEAGVIESYYGPEISKYVRVGRNTVTVRTTPGICVCNNRFTIRMVKSYSIENLVALASKEKLRDYDTSLNEIKESFMILDSDIQEFERKISLKDPLTLTKVLVPVRGVKCRHSQCFDLTAWLSMNRRSPSWKCPHCNTVMLYDEVIVDSYVMQILKETSEKETGVILTEDGTWKVDPECLKEEESDEDEDEEEMPSYFKRLKAAHKPPQIPNTTTTTTTTTTANPSLFPMSAAASFPQMYTTQQHHTPRYSSHRSRTTTVTTPTQSPMLMSSAPTTPTTPHYNSSNKRRREDDSTEVLYRRVFGEPSVSPASTPLPPQYARLPTPPTTPTNVSPHVVRTPQSTKSRTNHNTNSSTTTTATTTPTPMGLLSPPSSLMQPVFLNNRLAPLQPVMVPMPSLPATLNSAIPLTLLPSGAIFLPATPSPPTTPRPTTPKTLSPPSPFVVPNAAAVPLNGTDATEAGASEGVEPNPSGKRQRLET